MENKDKIVVGISGCLLGENVRYDGGHKRNSYINSILSNFFEFKSFCPEVAIGLGIPREPIRLQLEEDRIKCVAVKNEKLEFTDKLKQAADEQKHWHQDLSGYILKKGSPSCGMERVKLYKNGMPQGGGVGIYAQKMMDNFPYLPIEEEGRLEDAKLRENFIQRVYVYWRWKQLLSEELSIASLQDFHAKHKYIYMSHNQQGAKQLGALLAEAKGQQIDTVASEYLKNMMALLKVIASRKNHVNTLQHIQGYLKKHLDKNDSSELVALIKDYHQGLLPLIVPITLLRHHFRRHPNQYISQSYYLQPHPGELMLLNNL